MKKEKIKETSEKIVHNLFEEKDQKPAEKLKKINEPETIGFANDYYEQMKQKAIQRAHERFEKLKGNRTFNPTPDEL